MSEDRQVLNKQNLGITPGLPLEASTGGIEELRKDIQRLMDIEAIKQLKYAYFRCVDTANLEELATLFHEDVTVHFVGGSYEWNVQGRQDYVNNIGYGVQQGGRGPAQRPPPRDSDTERERGHRDLVPGRQYVDTQPQRQDPRYSSVLGPLSEGRREVADKGHPIRAHLRD